MCYFTNFVSRLPPPTGNEFTKSGREPGFRNHVHGPRCRHSIDTALMSVATSKKKKRGPAHVSAWVIARLFRDMCKVVK